MTLETLEKEENFMIQTIADTIADRSEKIDRMVKRLRQMSKNDPGYHELESLISETKGFVESIHKEIDQLKLKSTNKRKEIENIKRNLIISYEQKESHLKHKESCMKWGKDRLLELEKNNHITFKKDYDASYADMWDKDELNYQIIIDSMTGYCDNLDCCNDYYVRSLELWQSQYVLSHINTKIFFSKLVTLFNLIIIDSQLTYQYAFES